MTLQLDPQTNAPSRSTPRGFTLHPVDVLVLIGLGAALVTWWPIWIAFDLPAPVRLAPLTAHICGMLAGYGVLVLLALMSRAPSLERGVGADVLARWHARGGRLVIIATLVHAVAALMAWSDSRRESIVTSLRHVLGFPGLIGATVGTIMLVAVGIGSMRAARKAMSYERWHALHLLTYIGVALSFSHQLAGPDVAGHRWLQVAWALLYLHVATLLLRHRVVAPMRQAARHRLRVAGVTQEGPDVVSIEIEGQHLRELDAQPGQFFRWRFLTPDHWSTAHPFSLSAPASDTRLRLTVKALGDSSRALQTIAVGTWVLAEGPYGAMTARKRSRDNVVLIAGGVGITPLRCLFETLPLRATQDLTLIYRARGPEHVLFRDELEAIATRRRANLYYLLGDADDLLGPSSLVQIVPDIADSDVYLCGPTPMSDAVRDSLLAVGHPPSCLHEERFAW